MRNPNRIASLLASAGWLAAFCLLSVSGLAFAQGGPPNRDVRVINNPSEPVPVRPTETVPVRATEAVPITATEAIPVKVAARKPWQASVSLDLAEGETSKFVSLPAPAPGKRVVIESGSAQLLVLRTQVPYIQLFLSMTGSDPAVAHVFALTNVGAYSEGQYVWQSTHALRLTSAQTSVRVLRAGGANGPFFAYLALAGYEEDNE